MNGCWQYILDEHGDPVPEPDEEVWSRWRHAELFGGRDGAARVAFDALPGGVEVSTVFTAYDYNFEDVGPPLLYETMILDAPAWYDGRRRWRWHTRAEAQAGHARIVETLRVDRHPRPGGQS